MNLTTKFDADDMLGTLSLKLDPYTIVTDTKSGNSEMQYRGKIEFDVKEKNTQDSTHFLKGYVDFDVSLTQAEGDMYIRLLSLDGTLSSDPDGKEEFDNMMTESKKYIGKTYKVPNKQNFQPEDIYNLIKNGYSLLSTSPLFTVVSKNQDGSYRLRMNVATLEKLGIDNPEKDKTLIIYKNTRGKKEIRIMPKSSSPLNHITLSDNFGKKTLSGRMFDNTSYSKSDMRFSVSKDMFFLTINEQDSNIKALWRDNTLAIALKQLKTEYQDELSVAVTGQLSPNLRTMDLNLMWNGKKIGNLSSSV